jgi:hypothetical protein
VTAGSWGCRRRCGGCAGSSRVRRCSWSPYSSTTSCSCTPPTWSLGCWPTGTRPGRVIVVAADPVRVALAHQVLAQLGVSLADLHATEDDDTAGRSAVVVPTIADYLPRVIAAAGPGAARTYGSYWTRVHAAWGDRRVDSISASDIEAIQRQAIADARRRRTSRSGRVRRFHRPGRRRLGGPGLRRGRRGQRPERSRCGGRSRGPRRRGCRGRWRCGGPGPGPRGAATRRQVTAEGTSTGTAPCPNRGATPRGSSTGRPWRTRPPADRFRRQRDVPQHHSPVAAGAG